MSFIDAELDAIEEEKPVAEGEYNLIIKDVKEKEKDGEASGLLVLLDIEGHDDAATVMHNISFPLGGDDDQKRKNKLKFMKRFLVLFGIPYAGGLDLTRFPGARAKCFLKQEEYNGEVSNKIVLPKF